MIIVGILLIALGIRAACDQDNQAYQTLSGIIVALLGGALIIGEQAGWIVARLP